MRIQVRNRFFLAIIGSFLLTDPISVSAQTAAPTEKAERFVIVIGAAGQEQYELPFCELVKTLEKKSPLRNKRN